MSTPTLRDYLQRARDEGFAIGQFNISTHGQLKAIMRAATAKESPVIIGTSHGESDFIGLHQAVAMVDGWRKALREERGSAPPVFLNLDHAKDVNYIINAMEAGYDAVHYDGSELSLEENISNTVRVTQAAPEHVLVEGEVGRIGTESSQTYHRELAINEENLTDPKNARQFIGETGVDSLAISVGTFHGIEADGENPHIALDLLERVADTVSSFLVLHGSSGTPTEDVAKAVELGIDKINVNTDLRIAYSTALRESLRENPGQNTPYKYLPPAVDAMQQVVEEKIDLFGSAGKW